MEAYLVSADETDVLLFLTDPLDHDFLRESELFLQSPSGPTADCTGILAFCLNGPNDCQPLLGRGGPAKHWGSQEPAIVFLAYPRACARASYWAAASVAACVRPVHWHSDDAPWFTGLHLCNDGCSLPLLTGLFG